MSTGGVKRLDKRVDEEELNGMEILRELKRSQQEVVRLEGRNKLSQERAEIVSDSGLGKLMLLSDMSSG